MQPIHTSILLCPRRRGTCIPLPRTKRRGRKLPLGGRRCGASRLRRPLGSARLRSCAPAFFLLPPRAQLWVPRLIPSSGWGKILPAVAASASSLISSPTYQSHRRSSGPQKARNQCSLYQETCLRSWPLPPFTFEDSAQMSLLDLTTSPTAAHAPQPLQHACFTFFIPCIRFRMLGS